MDILCFMMKEKRRDLIHLLNETHIENGHGHYKVTDNLSGNIIHCEFNELNDTIYELLGWR